jgi:hypothetical protein
MGLDSSSGTPMKQQIWAVVRNLHLYIGLFLSPFVLLFAVSAVLVNHPWIPLGPTRDLPARSALVAVPHGIEAAGAVERVQRSRQVLREIGMSGEIGPVTISSRERRVSIPVSRPGWESSVNVNLETGVASIEERKTGFWDALVYLHKMPGPHLASIRRNSPGLRSWAVLSDATVWLLLFLTLSGIYLWVVVRSERLPGGIFALSGAATLVGIVYALLA